MNYELYISPPGAELIENRGIIYEGQTWKANGCDFYFNGSLNYQECPLMTRPVCYVFNGFVCCASQCPGRMPTNKVAKRPLNNYQTLPRANKTKKKQNKFLHRLKQKIIPSRETETIYLV